MAYAIDWAGTQARARAMSDEALAYAETHALEAARALVGRGADRDVVLAGKDASYYHDEASVYHAEAARRQREGRSAQDVIAEAIGSPEVAETVVVALRLAGWEMRRITPR